MIGIAAGHVGRFFALLAPQASWLQPGVDLS